MRKRLRCAFVARTLRAGKPMPENAVSPIVEVRNITARYGRRTVLDNVSLTVLPREIRVILGPSGCGKTTLLKTMVGLLAPSAGSVRLFGTGLSDLDSSETMALLSRAGILFQNGALLGSLTVEENVALPLQMHTRLTPGLVREVVHLKLSQVGLSHAASLLPEELSGGMRKRAALARALALDPPLLFCDEPSAGLDPVTAAGLDELLLSLRSALSITIVVVTHELASIEKIADNIVFLYNGRVLYEGPFSQAKRLASGPVADFFMRKEGGAVQDRAESDFPFLVEQTA
jgi:phospholipid/cholesterol/gamma-HCH transport system ATP-binding protein